MPEKLHPFTLRVDKNGLTILTIFFWELSKGEKLIRPDNNCPDLFSKGWEQKTILTRGTRSVNGLSNRETIIQPKQATVICLKVRRNGRSPEGAVKI